MADPKPSDGYKDNVRDQTATGKHVAAGHTMGKPGAGRRQAPRRREVMTSIDVPARSVALVEAASTRHAGTPARAGDRRGDPARAGTQTPVVVVGSGGGG